MRTLQLLSTYGIRKMRDRSSHFRHTVDTINLQSTASYRCKPICLSYSPPQRSPAGHTYCIGSALAARVVGIQLFCVQLSCYYYLHHVIIRTHNVPQTASLGGK